jgi:hypothetical protein
MKKLLKVIIYSCLAIVVAWGLLTLWVEAEGTEYTWSTGNPASESKVLIVYDPDPIYDLDKKVCASLAEGFKEKNIFVTIATVAAARKLDCQTYGTYVLCANTYNWRPDWAVTGFIKAIDLKNKKVFAITLGAGSTEASQNALEKLLIYKGAKILESHPLWLWRPNDESNLKESNVEIARAQAKKWAAEIAEKIPSDSFK